MTADRDRAPRCVGYRPEHTLASYQLAIDLGADFIETAQEPCVDRVKLVIWTVRPNAGCRVGWVLARRRPGSNCTGCRRAVWARFSESPPFQKKIPMAAWCEAQDCGQWRERGELRADLRRVSMRAGHGASHCPSGRVATLPTLRSRFFLVRFGHDGAAHDEVHRPALGAARAGNRAQVTARATCPSGGVRRFPARARGSARPIRSQRCWW